MTRRIRNVISSGVGTAGVLLIVFGALAFDVIPRYLLARMSAEERKLTDSSVLELQWVSRGMTCVESAVLLLLAAGGLLILPIRGAAAERAAVDTRQQARDSD